MDENTIKAIAASLAAILKRDLAPVAPKPLYTTREAAAFLGVKVCYIHELTRRGKIPYYRSSGGKLIYLRRDDLLSWAQAYFVPGKKQST
jgi:excisionase family DNA binding protein